MNDVVETLYRTALLHNLQGYLVWIEDCTRHNKGVSIVVEIDDYMATPMTIIFPFYPRPPECWASPQDIERLGPQ